MPRPKKAVSSTISKSNKVIKPPPDLWEALEAERAKRIPPSDAFTVAEYSKRFGITYSAAVGEIKRLANAGVIKEVGVFGYRRARHFVYTKS